MEDNQVEKKNLCFVLKRIITRLSTTAEGRYLKNNDIENPYLREIKAQTEEMYTVCEEERTDDGKITTLISEDELKALYFPLEDMNERKFSKILNKVIHIAFNDIQLRDFLGGRKSRRQRKQRKSRRHRQSRRWF